MRRTERFIESARLFEQVRSGNRFASLLLRYILGTQLEAAIDAEIRDMRQKEKAVPQI